MHINKISIYTHLITDTGTLFNNSSLCLKMTACALNHLVFSLCFHHIFNASTLNFSVVCPKELIGNNLPFTDRCSSSRIIFNVKFVNVPKTVYHMYFDQELFLISLTLSWSFYPNLPSEPRVFERCLTQE